MPVPVTEPDPACQFVTRAEVAAIFGVSLGAVDRWIARGDLPAFKVGPRFVRIRREDLAAIGAPVRAGSR